MREMEHLPPDQRAVLSLVLTQQKSYAEVASLLGISEQTVRERAHAALDALAAQGSINASSSSPAAARPVPAGTSAAPASEPSATPPRSARHVPPRPSSKTGGAILLGLIAVAIAVVAIVFSSGGGKGSGQTAGQTTSSTPSSTSTPVNGKGETGGVHLEKQLSLSPSEPSSHASGEGIVVSKGNSRAFYVKASGLAPTSGFYAVWLYKSPSDAVALGKLPPVDSKGRSEGGGPLARKLSSFEKLVITRETSQHPSAPGPIVLSAPLR